MYSFSNDRYNEVLGKSQNTQPEDVPVWNEKHDRFYYVQNGQASWDTPAHLAWRELRDPADRPYYRNDVLDETTWTKPAVLSWKRLDRSKYYLYNQVSKQSVWPQEAPAYVGLVDAKTGRRYWRDPRTNKATWNPISVEAAWAQSEDKNGAQYYYNSLSKETTWNLPEKSNVAWKKNYLEWSDDQALL